MAQQTKEIKRRMKSIVNIKQITKAMELVSTAKLRKSRKKLELTRPYYNTVEASIREILAHTKNFKHSMLERRELKTRLIIVLSSDRGLAGGYNINVIRKAEEYLKDGTAYKLVTVGMQAKEYFSNRNYDISDKFIYVSEDPTHENAKKIGDLAYEMYKKKEVDEVVLVYTHFNSALSLVPTALQLLPAENIKNVEYDNKPSLMIEYEPSPEEVLSKLVSQYINISIFGAMIESAASEQAARRSSMKNASDNADEMLEDLSLRFNRARQASITQEITEIVSGANALK